MVVERENSGENIVRKRRKRHRRGLEHKATDFFSIANEEMIRRAFDSLLTEMLFDFSRSPPQPYNHNLHRKIYHRNTDKKPAPALVVKLIHQHGLVNMSRPKQRPGLYACSCDFFFFVFPCKKLTALVRGDLYYLQCNKQQVVFQYLQRGGGREAKVCLAMPTAQGPPLGL